MKGFMFSFFLVTLLMPFKGNAGSKANNYYAYNQSVKLLKKVSEELVLLVEITDFPMFSDYPERKKILLEVLPFENLIKLPMENAQKNGLPLALDHSLNPNKVMVYNPFFVQFSGTSDEEMDDKANLVKRMFLTEASLIWGFDEEKGEKFASEFLRYKVKRPESSVVINKDFCICENNKSVIKNNCQSFCSDKREGLNFYGSTALLDKISKNPKWNNLYNWCTIQVPPANRWVNCYLEVRDENGPINNGYDNNYLKYDQFSNSFSSNLEKLQKNRFYRANLVIFQAVDHFDENRYKSDTIEFYLSDNGEEKSPTIEKLDAIPVSQYNCLLKDKLKDESNYSKFHYYFTGKEIPILKKPNPQFPCYDMETNGEIDTIDFPRLGHVEEAFFLWNFLDPKFGNRGWGSQGTINRQIKTELFRRFDLSEKEDIFWDFGLKVSPESESKTFFGLIMKPFEDSERGKYVCPSIRENRGEPKILDVLKDFDIAETESLFLAKSNILGRINEFDTQEIQSENSLLIRESLLKKIGFKGEDEEMVFFYPPDLNDPLVRKPFQTLFTIVRAHTPYPIISDKMIGCIPKVTEE